MHVACDLFSSRHTPAEYYTTNECKQNQTKAGQRPGSWAEAWELGGGLGAGRRPGSWAEAWELGGGLGAGRMPGSWADAWELGGSLGTRLGTSGNVMDSCTIGIYHIYYI